MEIAWRWQGTPVTVGATALGAGPRMLLLPALSSISTRDEMRPLQERLADRFETMAVDWPGFGDRPRPRVDWTPAALDAFVEHLLLTVAPAQAVIAAGHAAGYALRQVSRMPGAARGIALIAPTWRGPLPTMAGGQRPWLATVRRAIDAPVLGPLLYALNVSRPVLRTMAAGHVYSDKRLLQGPLLASKQRVTRSRGARFASVRFVTGGLDPVASREAFADLLSTAGVPVLVVAGGDGPRRSGEEMAAMAAVPGVEMVRLARGKLAPHEEFPDEVVAAVLPFLTR